MRARRGFSLIELSVVLIIIGLLLAAVVKGRNLIRSAELKKFYNTFVKQWELVYNSYYDRTGRVLGGPLVAKTNTGNATWADFVGVDIYDDNSSTDWIIRNPQRFKVIDLSQVSTKNGYYANTLIAAGLELPPPKRNYPNIYDLTATEAKRVEVFLTFGSDPVMKSENMTAYRWATDVINGTAKNTGTVVTDNATSVDIAGGSGKTAGRGNFMLLINVPFDVAAQIDRIVDGHADGRKGKVMCLKSYANPIPLEKLTGKSGDKGISDIIDTTNIKGLPTVDVIAGVCGGPFDWGNTTNAYTTMMYRLDF